MYSPSHLDDICKRPKFARQITTYLNNNPPLTDLAAVQHVLSKLQASRRADGAARSPLEATRDVGRVAQ